MELWTRNPDLGIGRTYLAHLLQYVSDISSISRLIHSLRLLNGKAFALSYLRLRLTTSSHQGDRIRTYGPLYPKQMR